jgi:hypothetical protein
MSDVGRDKSDEDLGVLHVKAGTVPRMASFNWTRTDRVTAYSGEVRALWFFNVRPDYKQTVLPALHKRITT